MTEEKKYAFLGVSVEWSGKEDGSENADLEGVDEDTDEEEEKNEEEEEEDTEILES